MISAAPAKEEKKQEAPKAAPAQAAKSASVPEPEELDEEEMYGQATKFSSVKDEDDGFQVEEGKQMTETLVIFERN